MKQFILEHAADDIQQLALQRCKYSSFTEKEWRWVLQQIEGRQRVRDKLPEIAQISDWWFPVRLSLEQCSSERTARHKAQLVSALTRPILIDITGGMGIDCYYMSAYCEQAYYIERNEELCRLAAHNFALTRQGVAVIEATYSDDFDLTPLLGKTHNSLVFYADPARRNAQGSKVFRLEDCEPNITDILPQWKTILAHREGMIMLKLSPMLDISAGLTSLTGLTGLEGWDVHVVAIKNEVKEVLCTYSTHKGTPQIEAVDLADGLSFAFTQDEENQAESQMAERVEAYLYEPHAALLKAGAYKIVGQRFGVKKLGINTHLYTSDELIKDWPGRIFRVSDEGKSNYKGMPYNVLTRNYVLGAEALRKQLKVKDGGKKYVIGTRIGNKPILVAGEII